MTETKFLGFLSSLHSSKALEALKRKRDKFVNNIFYIESFGNSVGESKLGAESGHYLLFNNVQGAHQ